MLHFAFKVNCLLLDFNILFTGFYLGTYTLITLFGISYVHLCKSTRKVYKTVYDGKLILIKQDFSNKFQ